MLGLVGLVIQHLRSLSHCLGVRIKLASCEQGGMTLLHLPAGVVVALGNDDASLPRASVDGPCTALFSWCCETSVWAVASWFAVC